MATAEMALTGGRWVLKGGIRRFVPNPGRVVAVEPEPAPQATRETKARGPYRRRLSRGLRTFCECGCLIELHENCPNCRAWGFEQERLGNLASFGRAA